MFTQPVYTMQAHRQLEQQAQAAGLDLMPRAAAAALRTLKQIWPDARRLVIVCGPGNNGGDGLVLARLALLEGFTVRALMVGDAARLTGEALQAWQAARDAGVTIEAMAGNSLAADLVVDAILGIGLDRAPAGRFAAAITAVNQSRSPCLALDLPSGVIADTGACPGPAIAADVTLSFIGAKPGLLTGAGRSCAGRVVVDELDIPAAMFQAVDAVVASITYGDIRDQFAPRLRHAHKGHFGHVLVIGGAPGFGGAARLAAEAAARCGAGLVSLATHPSHAAALTAPRPEIMCHAVADAAALSELLKRASVIAIGPGLGQGRWGQGLLAAVRDSGKPCVWDADALNLLSLDVDHDAHRVITPHPGEAARLLECSVADIQNDRLLAAAALVARYGGAVVLKGAGSIVLEQGERAVIIDAGNPGMASGGMGDVLTGVIAALLAQHHRVGVAGALGACVHAHAADLAAADGERGLLAGDLMVPLRRALNPQHA